jgi:hypothetical protein
MKALRALLAHLVDYAGLFPPAALDMARATAEYSACRAGKDAWALGRFVVPVSRLAEFAAAAPPVESPWPLSVLAGPALAADLETIAAFRERHRGAFDIEALELKAASPDQISAAARQLPYSLRAFVEIPVTEDPAPLVEQLRLTRLGAKIRTGGVTPEAFPAAADIVRFLRRCAECEVPFKATAGLHHPVRCLRPLTYAADSELAWMYGFLNVFAAACFLHEGLDGSLAAELLEEKVPEAIRFSDSGLEWREHRLSTVRIETLREKFAISFGSCSFAEPLGELRELHFL